MKKLLTVLALTLTCALSFGMAACASDKGGKENNNNGNGNFDNLTTAESVYGYSAASAGMLISSMNGGAAFRLLADKAAGTTEDGSGDEGTDTPPEQTDVAELERYMMLVESLLSDGGFEFEEQESDREAYAEKLVVAFGDIDGNELQYEMYYNRVLTQTETDAEDGETEENYAIEGVLVIDGADYEMRGEQETETEEGESESETELRVTLSETQYILVEQSLETEEGESEQEYSYSVFTDGQLTERQSFSYETEQDETELKMESRVGDETQTFYFETETENGESVIRVRIGDRHSGETYFVQIETDEDGNRNYVFVPAESED